MSTGPLRRTIGAVGLVALIPVLLPLASGAITPEDAAVRSVVIGLVAVVLGRTARVVLRHLLGHIERREEDQEADREAAMGDAAPFVDRRAR